MTSSADLPLSHVIAIARYAHTGRWIAKRLSAAVVEAGKAERAKHKRGERCAGCEVQTVDWEIDLRIV
jgi:hypothetical protein